MKQPILLIAAALTLLQGTTYAISPDVLHKVQYDAAYYDDKAKPCAATPTQLVGEDPMSKIYNYLISPPRSLTPIQAAGILGNLQAESGFNPQRVQGTPTPSGDRPNITVDGVTGYGIAQWTTPKSRQQGLVDAAAAAGKISGDLGVQLDYLYFEATQGGRPGAWPDLIKQTDVSGATLSWHTTYEGSADNAQRLQGRIDLANAALERIQQGIPGSTTTSAPGGCGLSGQGGTIVQVAEAELAKNVRETRTDGGGQIDLYTDGHPQAWCADFVSWVYKQAGKPFTGGESGGWRYAGANLSTVENVVFTSKSENKFAPEPGDFIIVHNGSSSSPIVGTIDGKIVDHVGLIDKISGNEIFSIEGNLSNMVATGHYLDYAAVGQNGVEILGWGRVK